MSCSNASGPIPRIALFVGSIALMTTFVGQRGHGAEKRASDDLETIRQRMLAPLLGRVDAKAVRKCAEALQADGSWPDIDYQDRLGSYWRTTEHLSRLALLAQAYAAPASELHGDADLRRAVFRSLDYWLDHDFRNPNWWWNDIGVPKILERSLLLLNDELSPEQRSKAAEILKRAKIGMTGQNLVWVSEITAIRGILENDPELVGKAYRKITDEIRISSGEGVQADFSFHQHGPCLYSHGYGAAFATDCTRIATQVAGTRWAFPPEKIAILSRLILDGDQWLCRGSATDFGASGRQIARHGQDARYLTSAARSLLALPTGREDEVRALDARTSGRPAPALVGNRHFWRSDMMVHHRPAYYASARMYSNRTANTDAPCNEEGLKSHHVADGCNVLMRTGREYADIYPVWDWQKIPGTTVEQKPELTGSPRVKGERAFVGGVSDGMYGMAALDFSRGPLAARKSWFFFDDEYVCLGAGITCTSDNPVLTTIYQCRLSGPVRMADSQRSREVARGEHSLDQARWVWHDQVAHLLLQPARIAASNEKRTGSWRQISHRYPEKPISDDVSALWIDHGKHPQKATYAYAVVPGIDADAVASYVDRLPVRVVRNDPSVQAVLQEKLGIAGVAFYEPGQVSLTDDSTVRVDRACLLLLRPTTGGLEISVSSPDGKTDVVAVELSGKFQGDSVQTLDGPPRSRVVVKLPGGLETGKSVTKKLARP